MLFLIVYFPVAEHISAELKNQICRSNNKKGPSAIGTAKKLTLAPIVGHLEETKPFARASKAVYRPGAGPVDDSSLSEMVIKPLRASSKNNRHHNSTAQHGIQKFQTTGPRQLTVYLENFNIRHAGNLLAK